MIFNKPLHILFHILFWMVIGAVPMVLGPVMKHNEEVGNVNISGAIHIALLISIFYFNCYFLYPRYFRRKKIGMYITLCFVSAVVFTAFFTFVQNSFPLPRPLLFLIFMKFFISLAAIGLSTFYRLMIDTVKEQREQQQRERDRLQSELTFLRSQVSPHFMFNVLNSLVALIRQQSDKLEHVVMELSTLMRYMLYDSGNEKVSLHTEIEYLKSYIAMQLLRFSEDAKVVIDIQQDMPNKLVEPMLLIPLVENAFKHGIGIIEEPEIKIKIEYHNDELTAVIENKFNSQYVKSDTQNSGIGLDNLKRRLSLLYADRYGLTITKNLQWFIVSLKLTMKDEMPSY
jgi:two-component system LytT family sensor kinase